MSRWGQSIENQIQEALQQGHFSGLKNEGKRLSFKESDLAGELWMANHILENNDALPEWLSLRKDIDTERALARRFRDEAIERLEHLPNRLWAEDARLRRLCDLYLKHARKVNLMVDQHNHRCPSIQHELVRIREDAIDRARDSIRRRRATEYSRNEGGGHAR